MNSLVDLVLDQVRRGRVSDIASQGLPPTTALQKLAEATGDPEYLMAAGKSSALANIFGGQQQPMTGGDSQPNAAVPQALPDDKQTNPINANSIMALIQSGLLTPAQGIDAVNRQAEIKLGTDRMKQTEELTNKRLANIKPPSGYTFTPDGGLIAVPGGPADTKRNDAMNKDLGSYDALAAKLDSLSDSADAIINHPGVDSITGLMGLVPNIPGGNAANAQALLENLKSKTSLDTLQAMRAESKTGGALGNVSDAEGKRLESYLAALSQAQSPEQFKAQLGKIKQFSADAKGRLKTALDRQWNGKAEPTQTAAAPTITPEQARAELARRKAGQ